MERTIILLTLICALLLSSCAFSPENGTLPPHLVDETATSPSAKKEDPLMSLTVIGSKVGPYYFTLYPGGSLELIKEYPAPEAVDDESIPTGPRQELNPPEKASAILSKEEMTEIGNLLADITGEEPFAPFDKVNISISTKEIGNVFFNYGLAENDSLNKLSDKIISLSPLEVIDFEGNPIKKICESD